MHPVGVFDTLHFETSGVSGVELSCSNAALAVDSGNLVHGAATRFLETAQIKAGVRIHLEKRIPVAAGLGGGSSNAAATLLGLNEIFDRRLSARQLSDLAASIGSDVPFFLQTQPALVLGRGERILPHSFFPALAGIWLLLIYPGFGISTAWAYQALAKFPARLNGRRGGAEAFVRVLETGTAREIGHQLYNALEEPVLHKYPVLGLYQDFFRERGAIGALMSGSGSTTFIMLANEAAARELTDEFQAKFGGAGWTMAVPL